MNVYYERQANGKFYHAGLKYSPAILDSILPGAIESPRRLEWIVRVQQLEEKKLKEFSTFFKDFVISLAEGFKDGQELTVGAANMLVATDLTGILIALARESATTSPICEGVLLKMEGEIPL